MQTLVRVSKGDMRKAITSLQVWVLSEPATTELCLPQSAYRLCGNGAVTPQLFVDLAGVCAGVRVETLSVAPCRRCQTRKSTASGLCARAAGLKASRCSAVLGVLDVMC